MRGFRTPKPVLCLLPLQIKLGKIQFFPSGDRECFKSFANQEIFVLSIYVGKMFELNKFGLEKNLSQYVINYSQWEYFVRLIFIVLRDYEKFSCSQYQIIFSNFFSPPLTILPGDSV